MWYTFSVMKTKEKKMPTPRIDLNDEQKKILVRATGLDLLSQTWMMWVPISLFATGAIWGICGHGGWALPISALVGLLAGSAAMFCFCCIGALDGDERLERGARTQSRKLLCIGALVKQLAFHFGDVMRIVIADYVMGKWLEPPSGIDLVPRLLVFFAIVAPPWAFFTKKGADWETMSISLRKTYWSSVTYALAALLCPLLNEPDRFALCVAVAEITYLVCGFVSARDEWTDVAMRALSGFKILTPMARMRCAFCQVMKEPLNPADIISDEEKRPQPPSPWKALVSSDGRKAGDVLQIPLPREAALELRWCPATTSAEWRTNNLGIGFFPMGSLTDEPGHLRDEVLHPVKFKKGFWMGTIPVTARQWEAVMDGETLLDLVKKFLSDPTPILKNPRQKDSPVWASNADFYGIPPTLKVDPRCMVPLDAPDIPVHYVTWHEACVFCRRLTELAHASGVLPAGHVFRLPTSAEWEYACRAGAYTTYNDGSNLTADQPRHLGLDRIAWYEGNARVGYHDHFGNKAGFHPCGKLLPNRWGIRDMHGNISTWCLDACQLRYPVFAENSPLGIIGKPYAIIRGGAWKWRPIQCRAALIREADKNLRTFAVGLRVVLASTHTHAAANS